MVWCILQSMGLCAWSHIGTGGMMGKRRASSALGYAFNAHDGKLGKASWRGT